MSKAPQIPEPLLRDAGAAGHVRPEVSRGTGALSPGRARIGNGRRRLGFALSVLISGFALLAVVGAAPAAAETCPNEQLRQESNVNPFTLQPFSRQLAGPPECRAYEMVTPSFKAGARAERVEALAPEGERLIISSIGAFGGIESILFGGKYEMERSASGWVARGITPPNSVFSAADTKFFSVSTNLTRTLWGLRKPSQSVNARDIYIRERTPTGADFVEVGPTAPPGIEGPPAGSSQEFNQPYSYAGASADLSHILFNAPGVGAFSQAWPGDTTIFRGNSLYEYVGTGNTEPELVGVSDGTTKVNEVTLPSGRLISDCATDLGSGGEFDNYNAVSATGQTVFFTSVGELGHTECAEATTATRPPVDELYARISGSETVAISEPTAADCATCDTSVRAPAIFQGASEDGSKVFFLTRQELVPSTRGLNLYEYDFGNHPGEKIVPISSSTGVEEPEVLGVSRVSEDGSHIYFVAKGALTTGPNGEGKEPTQGANNLYVYERDAGHPDGAITFVATLSSETDAELEQAKAACLGLPAEEAEACEATLVGEFEAKNRADEADWTVADERPVQATPDGRYVVFSSTADLTPGDTSSERQVFEYDAATEELVRVSIGQAGYGPGEADANTQPSGIHYQEYVQLGGFKPGRRYFELAISANGHTVVFNSTAALAPQAEPAAAAGAESVYEYRSAGPISNGGVFLISDGVNEVTPQGNPTGLDPSGKDVFFASIDRIDPADGDVNFDYYDAREKGGFSATPAPVSCETQSSCQGAAAPPQPSASALTPAFSGPADPKPSRCRKGQVKKRGMCQKRHPQRKKSHEKSKRSSTNRGGAK